MRARCEKGAQMLTAEAISALLRAEEGETLAFQERFGADVIETAVAFANTHGGTILMGVRDDAHITGERWGKEALRDYVNRIATATEPAVVPAAYRVALGAGEMLALQISEVPLKPVATRGRSYRRAGSTTRVMQSAEIAAMHFASTGQSMDALIEPRKTRADLSLDAVRRYMRNATQQGLRHFAEHDDPWQVLQKLELVQSDTTITRAAILLFGNTPQSPLTQAVVHAGRLEQLVHIMDHRIIAGTLIDQVEEAMAFVQKNLHVRFVITGAPARQEIWDYPLVALREAMINAICHRDYGDTADIQVKIFENNLHIWSPGTLPFDVSAADLLGVCRAWSVESENRPQRGQFLPDLQAHSTAMGQKDGEKWTAAVDLQPTISKPDWLLDPVHASRPRNKLIAQVFFDLGLIERYGGGIQRILAALRKRRPATARAGEFSGRIPDGVQTDRSKPAYHRTNRQISHPASHPRSPTDARTAAGRDDPARTDATTRSQGRKAFSPELPAGRDSLGRYRNEPARHTKQPLAKIPPDPGRAAMAGSRAQAHPTTMHQSPIAPLLAGVRQLIAAALQRVASAVNAGLTLLYWHIGQRIGTAQRQGQRAEYGKQVVAELAWQLTAEFGQGLSVRKLRYCMRLAEVLPQLKTVRTLRAELSWSHLRLLIALNNPLQRDFYIELCKLERWSVRQLQERINSMLFERTAISKQPEATIRNCRKATSAWPTTSPCYRLARPCKPAAPIHCPCAQQAERKRAMSPKILART